jgi:hypothetical protein
MAALPAARLKVHEETSHCPNGERPAWHAALSSWWLISPPFILTAEPASPFGAQSQGDGLWGAVR